VGENDRERSRNLRHQANEVEREWLVRHPVTAQEAVEAARSLRPLFDRLKHNPFVKSPKTLWEEEQVRQAWARIRERW
jgi:hypothetical protein